VLWAQLSNSALRLFPVADLEARLTTVEQHLAELESLKSESTNPSTSPTNGEIETATEEEVDDICSPGRMRTASIRGEDAANDVLGEADKDYEP
jgi:hypothetical protein